MEGAVTVNLADLYRGAAAQRPGDAALVFADGDGPPRTVSWGELYDRAVDVRDTLKGSGVGEGARLAVEFGEGPDLLATLVAAWDLEAVVVPVDPLWGTWLRDTTLEHVGAEMVVHPAPDGGVATVPLPAPPGRPPLPSGCAMVSYTSGTTGDPKGVVLRHEHLMIAYQRGHAALDSLVGTPARVGCSMRVSGLGVLGVHFLWAATMGATVVVLPEVTLDNARSFFDRQAEHGVEMTYLVPALVSLLNHAATPSEQGTLRAALSGGAPLPEQVQERFQTTFATPLLNIYGLTEVAFAAFFGDVDAQGMGTSSIGRPATVEARVRGEDGSLVDGPGRGVLEVRGPTLCDGYYDNGPGTAEVIPDGWLRTGDVVEVDGEGRFRIVARVKEAVMKGSFTVYLSEVDSAACAVPGVIEAGALRLDLPGGTEDVGLIVRVAEGSPLTSQAVKESIAERLGRQRAPRRVVVTTEVLPKVGHGKIDRRRLVEMWPPSKR